MKNALSASVLLPIVALIISTFLSTFFEPSLNKARPNTEILFINRENYLLPASCMPDTYLADRYVQPKSFVSNIN